MNSALRLFLMLVALFFTTQQGTGQLIELELVNNEVESPTDIVFTPDGTMYVVQREGTVRTLDSNGDLNSTVFLDLSDEVTTFGTEQGLLGMTFHPDYPDSNYFYVNYTVSPGITHISRFTVDLQNETAIKDSEKLLLTQEQPYANHNAGDLCFGPDGMLYFALGDGGGFEDPDDYGQEKSTFLSKVMRLDVDNGDPYAIPPDNPFLDNPDIADEVWALGLRNPWRISFDRETGDLWIGDVGQGNREEINRQAASSTGGENYGWSCYEGNLAFKTNDCDSEDAYTFPVWDYEHEGDVCSVTGGFVYRGSEIPDLVGAYIFGDFCSGQVWALSEDSGVWASEELLNTSYSISTFGEDPQGELYLADLAGAIYRIKSTITTGTRTILPFNQLNVSPNPTNDQVLLQMDVVHQGEYQFQLISMEGRTVQSWNDRVEGSYSKSISLDSLSQGIYILRIKWQNLEDSIRIVKD